MLIFKALDPSVELVVNVGKCAKALQQSVEQEEVSRVLDGSAEHERLVEVPPARANPTQGGGKIGVEERVVGERLAESCTHVKLPGCPACGEREKGQGRNLTSPTVGALLQDSTSRNYPDISG
ncbi:hypothetical protein PMIN03_003534 [Paraphaeosphaeria minitans]